MPTFWPNSPLKCAAVRKTSILLVVLLLVVGLLGTSIQPVHAATIMVNTATDGFSPGDTYCSLTEAIINVNSSSDQSSGDCPAGTGDDTLTFDPSLSGTPIILSQTNTINSTITISGVGQNIILSGNNALPVFSVGNTGSLSLDSITLQNGSAGANGGAILNAGTLSVTNTTLSANSSGGNGAGIYNTGTSTVTSSTISGNSANGSGGGIYNSGSLTLSNTTMSGNSAGSASGGGSDAQHHHYELG